MDGFRAAFVLRRLLLTYANQKANFKPPPQVESAVVRITPKTGSEKPKFNFAEMDGMLRVSFIIVTIQAFISGAPTLPVPLCPTETLTRRPPLSFH